MNDLPEKKQGAPGDQAQMMLFSAQYSSLDPLRDFVGSQAEAAGLENSDIYKVQLAVDEAFSNIVDHAFGGECLKDVECTCKISEDGLTVLLLDCGKPFDPNTIPDPDLSASLEERDIGGLGLYFMHQYMDEVEFTFIKRMDGEPECNLLRMVKLLPEKRGKKKRKGKSI